MIPIPEYIKKMIEEKLIGLGFTVMNIERMEFFRNFNNDYDGYWVNAIKEGITVPLIIVYGMDEEYEPWVEIFPWSKE